MKIQEQVENILKVSRKARNSDKILLLIYMKKAGMELTPAQETKFLELPSFETITRVRRDLQERGIYEASEEIQELRFKKYKEVKQGINYESPEALLEKQGYTIREWGE